MSDGPSAGEVRPRGARLARSGDLAESIMKAFAVVVGGVYATGLVVLSMSSASAGAPGVSLLRADAIAAGIWCVVPWVLCAPLALAPRVLKLQHPTMSRIRRRSVMLSFITMLTLILGAAADVLIQLQPSSVSPGPLLLAHATSGALAIISVRHFVRDSRLYADPGQRVPVAARTLHVLMVSAFILMELTVLAPQRLNFTPQRLGGRAPEPAVLRFRSLDAHVPRNLLVHPGESTRSREVLLRGKTDESLFVSTWDDKDAVHEIARDLVATLTLQRRRWTPLWQSQWGGLGKRIWEIVF